MFAPSDRITRPPSRWQVWRRDVVKVAAVVVAAAAGVSAISASNAAEIPKAVPLDASLVPVLANAASSCTATPEQTKAVPAPPLGVEQNQPPTFQTPMSKVVPVFSFKGFPDTANLRLNGSATVAGGRLVLASGRDKAGSAWATTRIDPSRSFSTGFSFEITKISDGIAFVVQGQSRTARGSSGEGLGYGARPDTGRPRIQPSLAVEFDAWANRFDPVGRQHVAVTRNGDITQHLVWKDPGFSLYGRGVANVWIDYDARLHRLRVYVSRKSGFRPAKPLLTTSVDLRLIVGTGQAYVGLTGGTGITTVADPVQAVVAWNVKLR
ncbi:L-type lectin-domain containing protein [Micromonospora sp. B11E3]|uniref:L-type lectin-domain containing protein n=1 Tax=Micromonospora sp. B11E3 TaxID=3153562 RepID=UPI00325CC107